MERAVAIKKLAKTLGKSLGYRVDPRAPTAEERAAAKADLPAAIAVRDEIKRKRDERYKAVLAADPEYQSLWADYQKAQKTVEGLSSITHHYRFTVGISHAGDVFEVKAEGDSWEEILDKLQTKVPA